MADPRDTDPADQTPREKGLRRRSEGGVNPLVVVILILILAALAYVVFAMM